MGINHFLIGHATGIQWSDKDIDLFAEQWKKVYEWYQKNRGNDLRIDELEDMEKENSWFGCQAGRNSISVTINGEISPMFKDFSFR